MDDDLSIRGAVSFLVRLAEYGVESFGSAVEFLASAHRARSACLVLDIQLDGRRMSGFDLHERLAADGVTIPIIFITTHDNA